MQHRFAITVAAFVVVVGIGSTVAWAATGGFSGHMGNGHMQQMGQGHMGQMDADDMQAMMARVHPDLDRVTLNKLSEQCSKAMENGTGRMHGSAGTGQGMHSGSGGMMNGSTPGGMMGSGGASGMMDSGFGGMMR